MPHNWGTGFGIRVRVGVILGVGLGCPVLGGQKIGKKKQLVCQSSGFLLKFAVGSSTFLRMTVGIHVQFCFFVQSMDIAFSQNLISINRIKKQNCTCVKKCTGTYGKFEQKTG